MNRRFSDNCDSKIRCLQTQLVIWLLIAFVGSCRTSAFQIPSDSTGLGYTNYRIADVPLSIHIVQVPRTNALYEIRCLHAGKRALGLDTLSDQLALVDPATGAAVAAINGDFYQRDRAYAGAPRGLQVIDGELISSPNSKIAFWVDVLGEAHATNVASSFEITWPDGSSTPFRLNSERSFNGLEVFTPAIGRSTRTSGGRELILERSEGSPWLPLRLGKTYTAIVREVSERGDNRVGVSNLVVSLGPGAVRRLPMVQTGAVLRITTATAPALRGVKTALSGGPLLVHNGRRQRAAPGSRETYEFTSMFEQHPRAAIGWNQNCFYLVEVDGRQRGLSIGMTVEDLASFMVDLGCQEALNLDGGGSATLWYRGEVRNSPCDRAEREIANCLVVTRKPADAGTSRASNGP